MKKHKCLTCGCTEQLKLTESAGSRTVVFGLSKDICDYCTLLIASVAPMVERRTCNADATGSNPVASSISHHIQLGDS